MSSKELREKFLDFFTQRGHTIIPSSLLLPADQSVLFTTAGMQQFKDYYLGKSSPYGNSVVSYQKCFRTSDIDEVGDERHLTFFEMLGNFSFGSYFKKESIEWAFEFITKELGLKIDYASVFKGDNEVPEDKESTKIWQELGMPSEKIKKLGREDNFWGPAGEEGPCGPTTEIYVNGIEVWNIVFNEFYCAKDKTLTPLKQKGVDTGMGLERLVMVIQNKTSVFETDLFEPLMASLPGGDQTERSKRIIADHIKGSVFLIADGVLPSNVEQGYILRRVLRRAIRFGKLLDLPKNFLIPLAQRVIEIYHDVYPELLSKQAEILTAIQNEEEKFEKTLEQGLKQFERLSGARGISGIDAFHLYDTYGFPLELTEELAKDRNVAVDKKGFDEAFKKHQEISRAGIVGKFGGVGKEATYRSAKLHTATHLLHQALREVLGKHVQQMGSDITPQRLRFDFSHPRKVTPEELKKIEELVNQKIKEDMEVQKEEMPHEDAVGLGALAFFKEKYPEIVNVYSIANKDGSIFSREICAGPHVKKTSELSAFKITKEESSGQGVRRIRGVLG